MGNIGGFPPNTIIEEDQGCNKSVICNPFLECNESVSIFLY